MAAHPPQRSTAAETLLPGVDPFSPPAPGGCEAVLGASLYGLAAATVELLGTLAAHGAAAELRAVGLAGDGDDASDAAGGGAAEGGGAGGHRWVKEIAIGVGGSDGGGGRGVEILEACWTVARDIDGVHGERDGGATGRLTFVCFRGFTSIVCVNRLSLARVLFPYILFRRYVSFGLFMSGPDFISGA